MVAAIFPTVGPMQGRDCTVIRIPWCREINDICVDLHV